MPTSARATLVRSARLLVVVWLGLPAPTPAVPPLYFFTVAPCRVVDTRLAGSPLMAGVEQTFPFFTGTCAIPSTAKAVSVNVTVTEPTALGEVRLYAAGTGVPISTTVSYGGGQTRANNAVVGLSGGGQMAAECQPGGSTHLIVDINGYFGCADKDGDGVTNCAGDCCDSDARVKPGQANYFSTQTLCGGYDYNCDANETPQFTAISDGGSACQGSPPNCIALNGIGWLFGPAPACGQSAQYRDCLLSNCSTVIAIRIQPCR